MLFHSSTAVDSRRPDYGGWLGIINIEILDFDSPAHAGAELARSLKEQVWPRRRGRLPAGVAYYAVPCFGGATLIKLPTPAELLEAKRDLGAKLLVGKDEHAGLMEYCVYVCWARGPRFCGLMFRLHAQLSNRTALREFRGRRGYETELIKTAATIAASVATRLDKALQGQGFDSYRLKLRVPKNRHGHVAFPFRAEVTVEGRRAGSRAFAPVTWDVPVLLLLTQPPRGGIRQKGLGSCYSGGYENRCFVGTAKNGKAVIPMTTAMQLDRDHPLLLDKLGALILHHRDKFGRPLPGRLEAFADPEAAKTDLPRAVKKIKDLTWDTTRYPTIYRQFKDLPTVVGFSIDRIAEITHCFPHDRTGQAPTAVFVRHVNQARPRTAVGLTPITQTRIDPRGPGGGPVALLPWDRVLMGPHDKISVKWIDGTTYTFKVVGRSGTRRGGGIDLRSINLDHYVDLFISPTQPTDVWDWHVTQDSHVYAAYCSLRNTSTTAGGVMADWTTAALTGVAAGIVVDKILSLHPTYRAASLLTRVGLAAAFGSNFTAAMVGGTFSEFRQVPITAIRLPDTAVYYQFGKRPKVFMLEGKGYVGRLGETSQQTIEAGQVVEIDRQGRASRPMPFRAADLPAAVRERLSKPRGESLVARATDSARERTAGSPAAAEHNARGNALYKQGKFAEAEAAYRLAVRLRPSWAAYHYNLSGVLLKQRRFAEAEEEASLSVKLNPKDALYHSGYGDVLAARGKWFQAENEYREAWGLQKQNGIYAIKAAEAILKHDARRRDEATYFARKALERGIRKHRVLDQLGLTP